MKTVKPGIRKKPNGRFIATKSIDGKRYYQEFDNLREAEKWKNKFHPLVSPQVDQTQIIPTASVKKNGGDDFITFKEVVLKYVEGPMKLGTTVTQYKKLKVIERFLPPLYSVKMCEMCPDVITELLNRAKLGATDTFGRSSFDFELKILKAIFNWYHHGIDFTFNNPITRYHKAIGKIKDTEHKKKLLTEDQLIAFIDKLPEPFQSMAMIQFCHALRIGEVAALNTDTVDFQNSLINITDIITWLKNVPKHERRTKTDDKTAMKTNSEVMRRLIALDSKRPKGCKFFFHHKGGPMRYDIIHAAYTKALKDAGLNEFAGTHLLRHTMGTMARRKSGLDAAQAILRHTTSRMAEHYAKLDVNEKASQVVIDAGEIFLRGRATIATNSDENLEGSGS